MRDLIAVDFETKPIERRPAYPPKAVGLALYDGRKAEYLAWGHPSGNNCTHSDAARRLKDIWRTKKPIFHNAKFDMEIAVSGFGLRLLSADEYEDTLFLAFLHNPRALDLSLKAVADNVLGMPPTERDRLKEWIFENATEFTEERITDKNWGAYISCAPGTIVTPYAKGDGVRAYRLFKKLYKFAVGNSMLEAYRREKRLMPVLMRMEQRGIKTDVRRLKKDAPLWQQQIADIDKYVLRRLGGAKAVAHLGGKKGFNIGSSKQLAEALESTELVGDLPKTKKGNKSTKRDVLAEAIRDPKLSEALVKRTILGKYLSTYVNKWIAAEDNGGYVYPSINQVRNNETSEDRTTGARTGRLSMSDSWQAIPKPERRPYPDLPNLRDYVLPDEKGQLINHRDYSQQELRILAHYENGPLLARYQVDPNMDVHETAREMINALTGLSFERRPVKDIAFGLIYGMGLDKTAKKTGQDRATTKLLRNSYMRAIPGFKELQDDIKKRCKEGDPIRTWGDRLYWVEEPRFVESFGRIMSFEYKMINVLVQGSAGDCTKEATIRVDEAFSVIGYDNARIMLEVHDEINSCVAKAYQKRAMKLQKEAMEGIEFDVKMLSDGKVGATWGSLKKYKD